MPENQYTNTMLRKLTNDLRHCEQAMQLLSVERIERELEMLQKDIDHEQQIRQAQQTIETLTQLTTKQEKMLNILMDRERLRQKCTADLENMVTVQKQRYLEKLAELKSREKEQDDFIAHLVNARHEHDSLCKDEHAPANREQYDNQQCKVCFAEPMTHALQPCGHLLMCKQCADAVQKCPMCRAMKHGTLEIHIA